MKKLITFLLISVLTLTSALSQSVDDILAKYFANIGGVEKWKTIKTMKMVGQLPTPQGEFTFEMNRKAPDKVLISVDVMGQKLIPQAFDGEVAWTLNPFTGDTAAQKISGEQAKDVKRDAVFEDPFIDYASKGSEVTLDGTQDVGDVKCFVLKLITHKGQEDENTAWYYFDSETYLPVMTKQTVNNQQMGAQEIEIHYSDFQDIGNGLIMPFAMENYSNGQSIMSIKFTKITTDEELPDEMFKYPGE